MFVYRYKLNPSLGIFEQKVICVPDVSTYKRRSGPDARGDVLMLACDGIFEVQTNESSVALVRNIISSIQADNLDIRYSDVARVLIQACLEKGSTDNMSVVLVPLN